MSAEQQRAVSKIAALVEGDPEAADCARVSSSDGLTFGDLRALLTMAGHIRLSSEELEDLFREAISDSADMDSDSGTYAKAVVRALEKELSA